MVTVRKSVIKVMDKKITENMVVKLWQKLAKTGIDFMTETGEALKVRYPGRVSSEPGADFSDAVIDIGGRLMQGNIELHVQSSDWQTHRHHKNSAYNGVVLHVVMWHDGYNTILENGICVPVLALNHYSERFSSRRHTHYPSSFLPCRSLTGDADYRTLGDTLNRAGAARFREKVTNFSNELNHVET
jgi:hypothetical protein